MQPSTVTIGTGPDLIINAFEAYAGTITDLDRGVTADGQSLSRRCQEIAKRLKTAGVGSGDRLILAVANGPLFVSTFVAAISSGASPVLVHAKTPPTELQRTSNRFGARFIATDTNSDFETGARASPTILDDDWGRLVLIEADTRKPSFQTGFPSLPGCPLHPTSGTTGQPKVAVRPGACAVQEAEHYIESLGIGAEDVILAAPPMSHAYGYGMCLMVPLLSGASIVTMREFKAKTVCRAIDEIGITVFPAVPGMIDAILFGSGERLRSFPDCVLSAGAPLSERAARVFREKADIAVRPLYGTTETGGISIAVEHAGLEPISEDSASTQPYDRDRSPIAMGYVGTAMNGVSVEARPSAVRSGEGDAVHTLHVRSSSMMAGYLAPGGIDSSTIRDGWFDTGDIAWTGDVGDIYLRGRLTEVINRGGLKVIPCEVEEALSLLPQVVEAKVYKGTDPTGMEFVKAAIVKDGELTSAEVRAHCEQHLVFYKRPATVLFVDSLPKTPSGKVILNQLP